MKENKVFLHIVDFNGNQRDKGLYMNKGLI